MRVLWSSVIRLVKENRVYSASPVTLLKMVMLTALVTMAMWVTICADRLIYKPWVSNKRATPSNHFQCDLPPSVWCSSKHIAHMCQVESQCEQWAQRSDQPVHLTLYLESLCPDCKQFVTNTLWPAWSSLSPILDLHLVPYGNANEKKNGDGWEFTCQHGYDECIGNLIETCAIHILKNSTVYFPLIHCIENSDILPINLAPKCASQLGINYEPIAACTKSPLGNKLEHVMALRTDHLDPPHTFVPWITLNGVHTNEIQQQAITNLVGLICDTYKGPKPPACQKQLNVHRKTKL